MASIAKALASQLQSRCIEEKSAEDESPWALVGSDTDDEKNKQLPKQFWKPSISSQRLAAKTTRATGHSKNGKASKAQGSTIASKPQWIPVTKGLMAGRH